LSKKIKTVYDANKSAGNDPSKNYLLPTQDEGNPDAEIALDIDQIAAAVSTRIGVSPPPEPTENLAQLVLTLQENTLVPNVQAITGIDYTHYNVVTDSATVPTYPTGFINGPVPQLLPTLAGWSPETKYVYLYDLPTTSLKPLTDSDGTSGITLNPVDTIAPTAIDDLAVSAVVSGTYDNATLTFTETDDPTPGSGFFQFDLLEVINSTPNDVTPIVQDINTPYVLYGLDSGANLDVVVRASDVAGNFSYSNQVTVETDTLNSLTFTTTTPSTNDLTDATINAWTTDEVPDAYIVKYNTTATPLISDSAWNEGVLADDLPITLDSSGFGDLPGFGDTLVAGWVRIGSVISLVISDTVTATATSGGDGVLSFTSAGTSVGEEFCPVITAVVEKTAEATAVCTVDYDIVSVDGGISEIGINYINLTDAKTALTGTLSFGSGVTSQDIDIAALYANLGNNTASFDIVLDAASITGDGVLGGITSFRINISGTNGRWASGDLDLNNLITLPKLSADQFKALIVDGATISNYELDVSSTALEKIITRGINNVTIENCILNGLPSGLLQLENTSGWTIRNNSIRNSDTGGLAYQPFGFAVMFLKASGDAFGSNKVLNNKFDKNDGNAKWYNYDNSIGNRYEYNYSTNITDKRWQRDGTLLNTNMFAVQESRPIAITCRKNIMWDPNGNWANDAFNSYRSRGHSTLKMRFDGNIWQGSKSRVIAGEDYSKSSTGFQIGDVGRTGNTTETGYWEGRYNTLMDQSHSGVAFSAGHHHISRNQNIYAPRFRPVRYGAGGGGLFFKRLGVSVPGDSYSCESSALKMMTYAETNPDGTAVALSSKTWDGHALTGQDAQLQPDGTYENQNLSPNHSVDGNPNIGDAEGDIIGYYPEAEYNDTTYGANDWQHSEWDQEGSDGVTGSSGYDLLWPYQVQNPVHSTLPGVIAWYAYGWFTGSVPYSASDWNPAATGYGSLAYNKATGDMTWAEYGDSAGAAVDVTAGIDEPYLLLSNNGASLLVFVDPDLLPTGAGVITVTTICVTSLRVKTQIQYAGLGGDFSIFNDPDDPPPTSQPAAPSATGTPTFDSATDTSITFTWTAATTTAAIAGHKIRRTVDGGADTALDTIGNVLTYTDTTAIDGFNYTYYVTAFDNWVPSQDGPISAESAVMNTTATGSTNIIYPESEFDDASAIGPDKLLLWQEGHSATTSFAAGVCTITNGSADSGQIAREVSDANGDGILNGGDYKLVIKASKGSANLQVMVHSTNPNPGTGDLVNEIISDLALTEYEFPFTTTSSQEINVILRTYSTSVGQYSDVDYCRLIDLN